MSSKNLIGEVSEQSSPKNVLKTNALKHGFRHSQKMLFTEGAFYEASMAFFDVSSVIPLFLSTLKAPLWLIGAISSIKLIGFYFPQTFVAQKVGRDSGSFLIRVMVTQWISSIGMYSLPLLWGILPNQMLYFGFLVLWTVFAFCDGSAFIPWSNLVGRASQSGKYARFLGIYQLSGGIGRIAAGVGLRLLLAGNMAQNSGMPGSHLLSARFALVFALGCLSYSMTIPLVFRVRRNLSSGASISNPAGTLDNPGGTPGSSFVARVTWSLERALADPEFRRFLLAWLLSFGISLSTPFVLIFGSSVIGMTGLECGLAMSIEMVGTMAGSFLVSLMATRKGVRALLKTTGVISFAVPSLALLSGSWAGLWYRASNLLYSLQNSWRSFSAHAGAGSGIMAAGPGPLEGHPTALAFGSLVPASYLIYAAMFFVGMFWAFSWVSSTAFVMERVDGPERPMVLAAVNTLSLPLAFLGTLGGVLANRLDYPLVFGISLCCGIAAVGVAFGFGRAKS